VPALANVTLIPRGQKLSGKDICSLRLIGVLESQTDLVNGFLQALHIDTAKTIF